MVDSLLSPQYMSDGFDMERGEVGWGEGSAGAKVTVTCAPERYCHAGTTPVHVSVCVCLSCVRFPLINGTASIPRFNPKKRTAA